MDEQKFLTNKKAYKVTLFSKPKDVNPNPPKIEQPVNPYERTLIKENKYLGEAYT